MVEKAKFRTFKPNKSRPPKYYNSFSHFCIIKNIEDGCRKRKKISKENKIELARKRNELAEDH